MKFIESKVNALIKKFRSLSVKKYREQFSLFKLEGEKVVRESLKYLGMVENIIIDQDYKLDYQDILNEYEEKCIVVNHDVFVYLSDTVEPQHIMAICNYKNSDVSTLQSTKVLALDHLQDPGNLGTIIRSAVASGFTDIILIDSVDPYNDKTIRSASGTIFFPKFYKLKTQEFLDFTKSNGYSLLIAEAGKQSIFDSSLVLPNKYILVIGNEGNGISEEVLSSPHKSISIPMDAKVESLNAGVSASVLMFILSNKN